MHDALTKIISCDNQRVFIEFINRYQSQTFNCRCSTQLNDIKLFSLFESVKKESTNILKYLLQFDSVNKQNSYKETPLHLAARNGHKEIVDILLHAGANLNAEDNTKNTPLHSAARNGHKEIVEVLLKAGANPNAQDYDKETPLHLAANNKYKEIVELLIHAGADPNAEDNNKWTPLHSAARDGYKEIVEMLLKASANSNAEKNDKRTPLHLAARNGHKETVELLLHASANPNAENDDKETPLHLAAHYGNKEIFIILYSKTDPIYKNYKQILEYMKKINYNPNNKLHSIFILQSHEFDSASLFAKDYLCRDMILLILRQVNDEKLFRESEELIN